MSGWCWRRRPDPLNPSVSKYDLDEGKGRTMCRSKHTEAQIIGALKQVEAGRAVEDVAR